MKLYSRGPVFYKRSRLGLHRKGFDLIKFRTMNEGSDQKKSGLRTQVFDSRITNIGRALRKSYIDELPQFINVLRGHMSVVGPRPSPFDENQFCPEWREARLSIRPGITGLWQVKRSRLEGMDFQEWIKYDIEYEDQLNYYRGTS